MDLAIIENDQIIKINSYVVDYVIYPSELTNQEQFFAVYVKDMPAHMYMQLGSMCNDMRLNCTVVNQKNAEGIVYQVINIWSYDYRPKYI